MYYNPNVWQVCDEYKVDIINLIMGHVDEEMKHEEITLKEVQYVKNIINQLHDYEDRTGECDRNVKFLMEDEYSKIDKQWKEHCSKKFHYELTLKLLQAMSGLGNTEQHE